MGRTKAERAWQDTVDEMLRMFGCVTKHDYPLHTRDGSFRTGTTLRGWPDLFAFHPRGWALFIEIKIPPNRLEPEQLAVLSLATRVPCARAWVLKPDDPPWRDLQEWVKRPKQAPIVYGFDPVDNPERALLDAATRRAQQRAEARLRKQIRKRGRRDTLPGLEPTP